MILQFFTKLRNNIIRIYQFNFISIQKQHMIQQHSLKQTFTCLHLIPRKSYYKTSSIQLLVRINFRYDCKGRLYKSFINKYYWFRITADNISRSPEKIWYPEIIIEKIISRLWKLYIILFLYFVKIWHHWNRHLLMKFHNFHYNFKSYYKQYKSITFIYLERLKIINIYL